MGNMRGKPKWWLIGSGMAVAVAAVVALAHPGHPAIPTPTFAYSSAGQPIQFDLFRGNRIFIPAIINGHKTEVMLDSAASLTTVDSNFARSIALPAGFKIAAKGAGGVTDAELVSGLQWEIGGVRVSDASVAVMDLTPIEQSIGRPISAIIGRDFFNHTIISIDWTHRRLRISSPNSFKSKATAIAVELKKVGPFDTIPISVGNAPPIDALLDIGNGAALALPPTYWQHQPELAGLRNAQSIEGGVGGMHPARVATVPLVTIAGVSFSQVPATLSDSGNDSDPTQMANVGIGLLEQFEPDLDLGHDRIYLVPRSDKPAFDRDRAGVLFELLNDRLKAVFVSKDGPAGTAGLKTGDEIVAVNGRRITSAFYNAGDWTRGPAGQQVTLLRADGSSVRFNLSDYY